MNAVPPDTNAIPDTDAVLSRLSDTHRAVAARLDAARLQLEQTSLYVAAAAARLVFRDAAFIELTYFEPDSDDPDGAFRYEAITDASGLALTYDWSDTAAGADLVDVFGSAIESLHRTHGLPAGWPLQLVDDSWSVDIAKALTLASGGSVGGTDAAAGEQRHAAQQLAAMHPDMWHDNAGHFNCTEAEAIAAFLRAFRDEDTARTFLRCHAEDDDEGDEHSSDGTRRDSLPDARDPNPAVEQPSDPTRQPPPPRDE